MKQAIGHNELYKMGFDGASIQQMRGLNPEKNARLIEILKEFASVSQLVESHVANVDVAGSIPVTRSRNQTKQ